MREAGMTPHTLDLHIACRTGTIDEVRRLLDESPDLVNRPRPADGCSPLHCAAFGGQTEVVDELLRRAASVAARDRSGYTPLHYAAFAGSTGIARRLMDAGADPLASNDSRTTVLHAAAAGGALDLVEQLLDRGVPPDTPNLYGETPLHRAAQANRLDVVRRLMERGATIDPVDRYHLGPVQKAAIGGAVEALEWLVDSGCSLDERDLCGDTPLHGAAGIGRASATRWLLERGVDVDSKNAEGRTPLHAAARRGAADVVDALLARGADPNAVDALGQSPLHVAAASGRAESASLLIAAGSLLDAADAEDRTPLDLAATYARRSAYRALSEYGARGRTSPAAVQALVARPAAQSELVIWYLGNSGWAVRSARRFLVIDYAPDGDNGEEACLPNGRVVAGALPGLPVTVLVTHHHADHFSPRILDWAEGRDVRYVFGWDAQVGTSGQRFLDAGHANVGGVRVTAIPSTDSGSAFLIEVDGFRIYHAGDHSAAEIPPEPAFADGVASLGERFAPVDLAFLPVFGCGLPSVASLRAGNDLAIDCLAPRAVFPMHVSWTGHFYREEKRRLEAVHPGQQVVAVGAPGDRCLYRGGRILEGVPWSAGGSCACEA
jgi:ankyrin repeat protein/L-ascorbate metabolism protein UlaG (beta-lactamase superfamily)